MFKLYCLPGKFFARIGYLFPGKNQLWASGRRRDSRLAHFLFATPFWLVVGLIAFGMIFGSFSNTGRKSNPESVPANDGVSELSASITEPVDTVEEPSATIEALEQSSELITESKAADSQELGNNFVPGAETESAVELRQDELGSLDEVQGAIRSAFISGQPERWEAQGMKGYAVPSVADSKGCRNISYSVDSQRSSNLPTTKVCE
jgi:hypothetical protein